MLSETQLKRFQAIVEAETGLCFLPQKAKDLERTFNELFKSSSFADLSNYLDWLEKPEQREAKRALLVSRLTVGETYFLRDKNLFQLLQDQILGKWLPERFSEKKELTIWSVGCSTGEEPYSIAILLNRLNYLYKDWQVNILGSDINKAFLDKARKGVYSLWSFRQTPQEIINRYFSKKGDNQYAISPELKEKVSFFELNLADFSAYPGALNKTNAVQVILCRNVLMYFSAEIRRRVVSRLTSCLLPGAWFLVSPGEVHLINQPDLKAEQYPGVTLFQKQEQGFKDKKAQKQTLQAESTGLGARKKLRKTPGLSRQNQQNFARHEKSSFNKDKQALNHNLYNRAWNFYEQGKYNDAIYELYRLVNNLEPDKEGFLLFSETQALMARLKANTGDKEEALMFIAKAIEKEKLNPELYYLQAAIKQEKGKIQEAIQSLQQVLYLDPDCIMAAFNLGLLLRTENKMRTASRHFYNVLHLLEPMQENDLVPLSEGLTVKQLKEMIPLTDHQ